MTPLPVKLQSDEHLIMRVRRHTVFLQTKLLSVAIVGAIPVVILLVLSFRMGVALLIPAAIWAVAAIIVGYFVWYRYENDEWIITNQRLIDSLKRSWFDQHLVSTDLIQIEDMSVSKSGFLQTMFDYGDLRCETAGHTANFVLHGIPDPASVLDIVDTARDQARQKLANVSTLMETA